MARAFAYLFTGKGGAGKTTCAAAFALAAAGRGRDTLVVSLDQAHNLGDVLGERLGAEPREVAPHLRAQEADIEAEARARLERASDLVRSRYRYLSAAAMDPLLDLLGDSPGTEEYAAAGILVRLLRESRRTGFTLVVDLPPSGQAWRILAMPDLTSRWCRSLSALRRRLLNRRETLERILGEDSPARWPDGEAPGYEPGKDPVSGVLAGIEAADREAADALRDPASARIVGVTGPDRLSLVETARLADKLGQRGMGLHAVVLNRARPGTVPDLGSDPVGPAGLSRLSEAIALLME